MLRVRVLALRTKAVTSRNMRIVKIFHNLGALCAFPSSWPTKDKEHAWLCCRSAKIFALKHFSGQKSWQIDHVHCMFFLQPRLELFSSLGHNINVDLVDCSAFVASGWLRLCLLFRFRFQFRFRFRFRFCGLLWNLLRFSRRIGLLCWSRAGGALEDDPNMAERISPPTAPPAKIPPF